MSPRECEGYALTIHGVGNVAVCNTTSARIIHETIADLRQQLAAEKAAREKADGDLANVNVCLRSWMAAASDVAVERDEALAKLKEAEAQVGELEVAAADGLGALQALRVDEPLGVWVNPVIDRLAAALKKPSGGKE